MLRAARTGTPCDWLVVGLGNPGTEYEGTRHNLGAEVVSLLALRHGGRLRASKEESLSCEVRVESQLIGLAFPTTYMNDSGRAVIKLIRRHGLQELDRLVVVHDELDLPVGRIQLKLGGGVAGHNGLRSLGEHLHSNEFARIHIGVGRPPGRSQGADYVLRRPPKAHRVELDVAVVEAADAAEAIIVKGLERAMNQYNTRPEAPPT